MEQEPNNEKETDTTTKFFKNTWSQVATGILFVFITELCLGLILHLYMVREFQGIRDTCASKVELEDSVLKIIKSNAIKDELTTEILESLGKEAVGARIKRHNYFYLGYGNNGEETIAGNYIRGPPGPRGEPGAKGDRGAPGELRIPGASTFNLAELETRLGSLKGERGDPGPPGRPGIFFMIRKGIYNAKVRVL